VSISFSCGVRREYQNPLDDHKTKPLPTSLLPIEYPDYSLDVACRPTVLFPNIPKEKYLICTKKGPTVDASTSNLRRNIGDSDDENKFERWNEGAEREVLTTSRKLEFGLPKKTKVVWLTRVILYAVFPPKSTMTFVPLPSIFKDSLLLICFGIHISSCSMSITILTNKTLRDDILTPPSLCKLNTFVLLLVNQQCRFAQ